MMVVCISPGTITTEAAETSMLSPSISKEWLPSGQ